MAQTKICIKCNKIKDMSEFHKDSSKIDKLHPFCKICRYELRHKHYINNKEKTLLQRKMYRLKNPKCDSNYNKKRKITDINFKLACNLRTRLNMALKNNTKNGSCIDDLGCSVDQLKIYLESLFEEGMNWNNYGRNKGQWSIDHIIPLSKVNLSNRHEFLKVNNYKNLQPMWHIENISIGNRK